MLKWHLLCLNIERQKCLNMKVLKPEWLSRKYWMMKISYLWKWAADERHTIAQLPLLVHQCLSWHQKWFPNFWQLLPHWLTNNIFLCIANVLPYFHLHLIGWLRWLNPLHPFPLLFLRWQTQMESFSWSPLNSLKALFIWKRSLMSSAFYKQVPNSFNLLNSFT